MPDQAVPGASGRKPVDRPSAIVKQNDPKRKWKNTTLLHTGVDTTFRGSGQARTPRFFSFYLMFFPWKLPDRSSQSRNFRLFASQHGVGSCAVSGGPLECARGAVPLFWMRVPLFLCPHALLSRGVLEQF